MYNLLCARKTKVFIILGRLEEVMKSNESTIQAYYKRDYESNFAWFKLCYCTTLIMIVLALYLTFTNNTKKLSSAI
jgi:hypothetical protein